MDISYNTSCSSLYVIKIIPLDMICLFFNYLIILFLECHYDLAHGNKPKVCYLSKSSQCICHWTWAAIERMISMVIGLIYRTEGIILINTLYLKETFYNITVFVAFNVTIDVMFNIKYPFVINNIYMRLARVRIHVPLCI